MKILLTAVLLLFSSWIWADGPMEVELSSGNSIILETYDSDGEVLLLYLPSERGFSKQQVPTVQQLAFLDKDVWMADLHASYMVPKSRSSLSQFDISELIELIDIAKDKGFKKLFFVSSGRGAQLALKMANLWQLKHPDEDFLRGHIFHSPHLIDGKPEPGTDANYVDIAKVSNLPIYLIVSQYGTKYLRTEEIVKVLKTGGSSVFTHRFKGVKGGFHMRNEDDLDPIDLKAKETLAETYVMATGLLQTVSIPKVLRRANSEKDQQAQTLFDAGLNPYRGKQNLKVVLPKLSGETFDLAQLKGKVVLVNFWASWCRPCVTEIPSLMRLKDKLKDQPFAIVAINVGESKQQIEAFKARIPFDFPVVLDLEGQAVRDWGVYAYPSNFLLDKQGVARYAYRGALEWDDESVVKVIQSLF